MLWHVLIYRAGDSHLSCALTQAPAHADTSIPQTTTGLTKKGGRNPALLFAFLLPIRAQIAANSAANLLQQVGIAGFVRKKLLWRKVYVQIRKKPLRFLVRA